MDITDIYITDKVEPWKSPYGIKPVQDYFSSCLSGVFQFKTYIPSYRKGYSDSLVEIN